MHLSGSASRNGAVQAKDGDVWLHSSGDLRLSAVDVEARHITAKAGKALRLDTLTRERVARDHEQRNRKAWFIPTQEYSRRTTQTTVQHLATHLEASGTVHLESGTDMQLTAATVKAGEKMSIDTGARLTIDAVTDSKETFETVRHRKHLWRGDSNTTTRADTARGSDLSADTLHINSLGDVAIRGSKLHARGDGILRTAGKATIDSVAVNFSKDAQDFRGDLIGGHFFSTTTDNKHTHTAQRGSELRSESNLRLEVTDTATLIGSRLSAAGKLQVDAEKAVQLLPALNTQHRMTNVQTQGFSAKVGETKVAADGKDGSRQYFADVGYELQTEHQEHTRQLNTASEISAGQITINSETHVLVKGARLESESGTQVSAPRIDLLPSRDEERNSGETTRTDVNLRVTGGMDRAGSAFTGGRETGSNSDMTVTQVPTQLSSHGDQSLNGVSLVNEGSKVNSDGTTYLAFDNIEQRAVHDRREQTQASSNSRGVLGATVEYTDITRPIEKVVKGEEQIRFQQQAVEDNLFAPSLGADLIVEHQQREARQASETAVPAQVGGAQVKVEVADALVDVGTQYTASHGQVEIHAGSHDQQATYNSKTTSLRRLDADTRLRVDTNTGADLNAKIVGSGGSIDTRDHSVSAVPSLIDGAAGIQVQLGTDGRYEGGHFSSKSGDIALKAPGTISLPAATDQQTTEQRTLDGSAWVKGGNSPVPGKSIGGSAIGKYQRGDSHDTQAQVARFDTPGAVRIHAGKQVDLEAPRIGSAEQPVASIDIEAGASTLIDTANDTHTANGRTYGGGLQASVSGNGASARNTGGLGASLELGQVDETGRVAKRSEWHTSGTARVASKARADEAVVINGLNVAADTLALSAPQGGIVMTPAQSTQQRNNKAVGVGLGVNGATATDAAKGYNAVHGRATLNLDKLDSTTYANSQVNVTQLQIDSRRDAQLTGVQVDAERIGGTVAGDLLVASRQDQVNGYTVGLDARLNAEKNPQGLLNGAGALAGPAAGKVKDAIGSGLQKVDPGFAPTLHLDVNKVSRNTVGAQSVLSGREGIALAVEGDTRLDAALLKSAKGTVELGGSAVSTGTLSGSDHSFGLEGKLSLVPEEMTQNLINAFTGTPDRTDQTSDLGLIRTKGHDREQTLQGEIKQREG
ncbi:hemagglutinin repeat-containing protein [Pseudomonas sp.]|uniref:hemagglutinin repeat-containing protein n=1 Tax=Pseudomonas sp. TaxID=306 RepID=UPI003CC58B7C